MDGIRISIYVVTYRNPDDLNNNIASILASGVHARIHVINNHSQLFLEPEHEKAVAVLHNSLRPDFSTGHLARNWNQALLHGFQDLNRPASDIVVTVQDDVVFKPDWFRNLIHLHRQYSFITMGIGDAFCSYLPEAVRKIGLWDERFCTVGAQEADYFLRALIYNRERSSINDLWHGRLHNAVEGNACNPIFSTNREFDDREKRADSLLIALPLTNLDRESARLSWGKVLPLMEVVFKNKWGALAGYNWTEEYYAVRKSLIPNYITYPYFEKDIEGLREKNYIVSDDFQS
jgi:hypothetical protein